MKLIPVLLGAQDWNNESWDEEFYPEDLPADWQLAFYANEYGTVVIELADFRTPVEREVLGEQLIDCHAGFRPLLKIDMADATPREAGDFLGWLAQLDEDTGLDRLCGVWLGQADQCAVSWQELQPWRAAIDAQLPIAADLPLACTADQMQRFAAEKISPVWRITGQGRAAHADPARNTSLAAWLALVETGLPARELAQQTRRFLEQEPPENFVALVVLEEDINIKQLQDYASLLRLITG